MRNELPIFREIGAYSGNPRNIAEEAQTLQEPDHDDPEAWLAVNRFHRGFRRKVERKIARLWGDIDFARDNFYICGQSHIDVAWKWRYSQTLRKAIVTYRKAVWHVQHHAKYRFALSQPVLLEWIRTEDPSLFDKIKDAVRTGRLDLVGGMWLEPDCHLPSGESFVRQRLYGQLFYLKHFGKISDVEWAPDSFGFADTLPQIIAKSGSKYFYSRKLNDNQSTAFPFIQFLWQSPDGSQLLVCLNQDGWDTLDKHNPTKAKRRLLEQGQALIADYTTDEPEEAKVFSDEIPDIGVFMGKGDGGHGPTAEEVAIADFLVEKKSVSWISATDYFHTKLEKHRARLPVWNDELYYEFHRGTFTTHDLVKRMNRYFEWRLCTVEALLAIGLMRSRAEVPFWREKIERVWKLTLLNQFHDVLPGTSIPEVFDDCYDIWDVAKRELDAVERHAWDMFANREINADSGMSEFIVFNGTGLDVENLPIEVPLREAVTPVSAIVDGTPRVVQIIDTDNFNLDPLFVKRPRRALFSISMAQHSFKKVLFLGRDNAVPPIRIRTTVDDRSATVENDLYSLRVSRITGNIESVFFKTIQRELLAKPGIQLNAFFDWLPDEQCWNILPEYRQRMLSLPPPARVELVECGPARATIEISRTIRNDQSRSGLNADSRVLQRLSVDTDSPGIHMDFLIDWHSCECILKCDIHTGIDAKEVVAEVPYGTNTRLTHPTANHDMPRWENFHHTWVDLPSPDRNWGIGIINNGKYGYDAIDSRIGLTVLRGPRYPSPSKESWVHEERAQRFKRTGERVPTHAEIGAHLIQYILLPHKGDWAHSEPSLPSFAHWFNQGYAAVETSSDGPHAEIVDRRLIWCDSRRAEISVVKPAETGSGFVVRLVESQHEHGNVTVRLDPRLAVKSVHETDLLERCIDHDDITITSEADGSLKSFSVSMKPHEIRSFLLT